MKISTRYKPLKRALPGHPNWHSDPSFFTTSSLLVLCVTLTTTHHFSCVCGWLFSQWTKFYAIRDFRLFTVALSRPRTMPGPVEWINKWKINELMNELMMNYGFYFKAWAICMVTLPQMIVIYMRLLMLWRQKQDLNFGSSGTWQNEWNECLYLPHQREDAAQGFLWLWLHTFVWSKTAAQCSGKSLDPKPVGPGLELLLCPYRPCVPALTYSASSTCCFLNCKWQ